MLRSIEVAAHAGTAFDGRHLFQIAEDRIQKIDLKTGRVLATIPAPGGAATRARLGGRDALGGAVSRPQVHQIDPETGAILRTIETNRFVTGVTWIDGELWHGTWEGDEGDLTRIDPRTGEVLERLEMPSGVSVSGLGPTAAISSSAAAETAGRCGPSAGRSEAERRAAERRLGRVLHETQPTGCQRDAPSPGQVSIRPSARTTRIFLKPVGMDSAGINVSIRLDYENRSSPARTSHRSSADLAGARACFAPMHSIRKRDVEETVRI